MGIVRAQVRVFGRVQGVFFRQNTALQAKLLGIGGWMRNREDGSVEALFEGEEEGVERMVEWCRKGPPAARVENIEVERAPAPGKGFASFEIIC